VKELLEFIARRLVDHPDAVEVDVDIEDDDVILTLSVDEQDMGRVIGRDGRVANSIRSLLRVVGTRSGQHVELEITGNE